MSNIYAVGDGVASNPQNNEIGEMVGKLLGRRLFKGSTEILDYFMIPNAIYTPTEYAYAGLSENAALYRFGKECVEVYQGFFLPLESISLKDKTECFVKAVVYKTKNLIIGLHIFGPQASEIIQGFAAAIKLGMTINQINALVGVSSTNANEVIKISNRSNEIVKS